MSKITLSELRYKNFNFEIADIFHENWMQRKEFSLYKNTPRPLSALFFVLTDIEVSFICSEKITNAKKGDVVFIPEGSRYFVNVFGNTATKIDTYTINFNITDQNGESLLLSDGIEVIANRQDNLFEDRLKNLSDVFYRIEKDADTAKRNYAKIKGRFFLLLDELSESSSQCNDYYYPIRRGIEAFCNEWNKNEKIEKYAQLCSVSETYFYRCFKKWSGSSPIEYRNMLRLANAESLLRCTDMKIKEISEAVGFDDAFYFCRIFSENFGSSPKAYRNHIQNQSK